MKADMETIRKTIREILSDAFNVASIVDVNIREDEDFDGERILLVDVIFKGEQKSIDASRLAEAIARVRPALIASDEEGFPVFSFIAHNELGGSVRARARPH